jgi:hypothetical protein
LGINKETGKRVALKMVDKKCQLGGQSTQRKASLKDEVVILSKIKHNNVSCLFLFFDPY